MKMAETPEGAELIDNPVSVAPGFTIGNVHVLPGVPSILQAMWPGLKSRLKGGATVLSRTITVLCPEGEIARPLGEIQANHPTVEIGSYPLHAPGPLRHQSRAAQRRPGSHRRRGRGDPGRDKESPASRCWTYSDRRAIR